MAETTEREKNTAHIIIAAKELKTALDKFERAWNQPHMLEKTVDDNSIFATPDYPGNFELREFLASLPRDIPEGMYYEQGVWKVKL